MTDKLLLTGIAALLLCRPGLSQNLHFIKSCGDKTENVTYEVTGLPDGKRVDVTIGSLESSQTLDAGLVNKNWHYRNPEDRTDVTISLSEGVYRVTGTLNGKPVDKEIISKGHPWRQNFAYSGGVALKGLTSVLYECFNPRNMNLHSMKGTVLGETQWEGKKAVEVQVTVPGDKLKIWSCRYYYDPRTLKLVGYKAVEGMPGTSETTWTAVE